jgi:hypothetical protein
MERKSFAIHFFEELWADTMIFKTLLSCCALGFCAPVFGTASAAEKSPMEASQWMALDSCTAYSRGFASAGNTSTCAQIGGHLRVEWTRSYYQTDGRTIQTSNFATSGLAEPQHLRVGADDPYTYDPFVEPVSSQSKTAQ